MLHGYSMVLCMAAMRTAQQSETMTILTALVHMYANAAHQAHAPLACAVLTQVLCAVPPRQQANTGRMCAGGHGVVSAQSKRVSPNGAIARNLLCQRVTPESLGWQLETCGPPVGHGVFCQHKHHSCNKPRIESRRHLDWFAAIPPAVCVSCVIRWDVRVVQQRAHALFPSDVQDKCSLMQVTQPASSAQGASVSLMRCKGHKGVMHLESAQHQGSQVHQLQWLPRVQAACASGHA
jgi:hypothetical protein